MDDLEVIHGKNEGHGLIIFLGRSCRPKGDFGRIRTLDLPFIYPIKLRKLCSLKLVCV